MPGVSRNQSFWGQFGNKYNKLLLLLLQDFLKRRSSQAVVVVTGGVGGRILLLWDNAVAEVLWCCFLLCLSWPSVSVAAAKCIRFTLLGCIAV